ncbi:hypothetical protein MKK70_21140 [Methylobacterium sp. E-041]|uniref:hypothetical protein n=1 Tax=Methylobacterium sp. E-041 TaxID=2836573 RepID=UPI001FBA0494|nr:hypothetical protein [Methylobacterium sp. E-041]MCJ2107835.1 hypothetical protein [Methylobacterium sp. E-041]
MSDTAEPKRARRARRHDPTALRRSALEHIGSELGAAIQPPVPPGLGEGLLDRAAREDTMQDRHIANLLGQLLARSEANGDQIDETRAQVFRMDEKLEAISRRLDGVAYQKDIASFMTREGIERKIEKSATEIKGEVAGLRKMGWGLTSAVLLGAVGLLVKVIMAAAHIVT